MVSYTSGCLKLKCISMHGWPTCLKSAWMWGGRGNGNFKSTLCFFGVWRWQPMDNLTGLGFRAGIGGVDTFMFNRFENSNKPALGVYFLTRYCLLLCNHRYVGFLLLFLELSIHYSSLGNISSHVSLLSLQMMRKFSIWCWGKSATFWASNPELQMKLSSPM